MKPQSFAYAAPGSPEEALTILADYGDAARVLAGGQSLVPLMNLRLARPELIVDINGVAGLDRIQVRDGRLRLGALVRHRVLELGADPNLSAAGALAGFLSRVAGLIGHLPVRVRGSIGGSLAHADPNAEWPLVAVALGAGISVVGPGGARDLAAEEFFRYPFSTALAPGELLTEVLLPLLAPGSGAGFAEYCRTAGAFPDAAACVLLDLGPGAAPGDGPGGEIVRSCRVAVGGVAGRPIRLPAVEAALAGGPAAGEALSTAAAQAGPGLLAGGELQPPADLPAGYLAAQVSALVADALLRARAVALGPAADPRRAGPGAQP